MMLNKYYLPVSMMQKQVVPKPQEAALATNCVMSCTQNSIQTMEITDRERPAPASYHPNIWNYESLQFLNTSQNDDVQREELIREVHEMLNNEDTDSLSMLELIGSIQRFGLGYHFEEDIKKALGSRFISSSQGLIGEMRDLHSAALSFRLLRQHGYHISQDALRNFIKDPMSGDFKAHLEEDVKGMLSLYEASYLGVEGENLMVEAMAFTRKHLKNMVMMMSKGLAAQVNHALEVPLHHRVTRQEARWYIEYYYNYEENQNPALFELAKLDFNTVQTSLQNELMDMSRWWKEMGLSRKLSFARDRLVESFFWGMCIAYEPQYSSCRKGITKAAALLTTIDDVYDVHGTLDELEIFTCAVKRWDVNIVDQLPYYMKLCFLALYNTINEMAYNCLREHEVNIIPYLRKAWSDVCEAFLQEAKWNYHKETPKMEEYIENSWVSSAGPLCLVHAYFLVTENITMEELQCVEKYHHLFRYPSLLFRLYNDLSTSKMEGERGETANVILCYMQETDLSEELARDWIRDLIAKTWRKMNENNSNNSPFSNKFIGIVFNLARIAHLTYRDGDLYGSPNVKSKNQVNSLLLDRISIT